MRSRARELAKSEEAVGLYQTAVDNEKEKSRLGAATLLDVITTEDRLTSALLKKVSEQYSYASAVARLRYETGTLAFAEGWKGSITMEQLTTVPFGD